MKVRPDYDRSADYTQVTEFRTFDRIMNVRLDYERLAGLRTFGAARHASSFLRCIAAMGSSEVALFPCGATEMFGAVVPQDLAEQWKSRTQQAQSIGQAELYPLLVARRAWASRLRGQGAVFSSTTSRRGWR